MRTKLAAIWENVRTSFWFTPTVMVVIALGLAFGMLEVDRRILEEGELRTILYPGDADGARLLLSTVAGSTITVAGVIFSITMVALTLASSQFGHRLLRNFMADRGNRFVLGTFVATFVYCMLVLRMVQGGEDNAYIPRAAISVSMFLALVSFSVLIYFFHHASVSIQADQIIDSAARQLEASIQQVFPEANGTSKAHLEEVAKEVGEPGDATVIQSAAGGYVRRIDHAALVRLAAEYGVVINVKYRAGHFAHPDVPLVSVNAKEELNDTFRRKVHNAFVLGITRTPEQDVEFAIMQLVEVALRGLSPGVNDSFTAISCIDRLTSAICLLHRRQLPLPYCYDTEGNLRLRLNPITYSGVLDACFDQIRQSSPQSLAVMIRLLDAFRVLAETAQQEYQLVEIQRHAEMIYRLCQAHIREENDRDDADRRYRRIREALSTGRQRVGASATPFA